MRADQLLVNRGIAPTRSAAQRLIASGAVRWRAGAAWALPRKAGEDLPDDCEVEVTDDAELRFVSRGGLKLDGALAHTGIAVHGMRCLDVGQGTGGFTDALLHRGAAAVVGIDVGHGQLNPRIADDARVTPHEGVNARDVQGSSFAADTPAHSFDIVTGDVSFISLTLVLPTLARYLARGGQLLMLVKPQFELQPQDIGKGGLVKDDASYPVVEQRIRDACAANALSVRDYFASPIEGGDGNREFFVWAQPSAERSDP
ncbi:TlyA family RNA methyltransferase [Piscinibacter sp.]|jgi:23S rRNA (cytidine1920-2'-O)/16S rRNA (cytidine1409-2'-O)-methyltransferase|uniref:TlyA family RNA methyltransferase n=1 Tax=Piscinibacter sp. TaxID=1903157 RepID=UPI00355A1239